MANYNLTTALASQYQKDLQLTNQDAFNRSEWDRYFLNPLKEQYNTAAQEITSSVNYDVSQAYNRYKQQQLALLQNQNIATGLQEQLTSQAASAYQSQYAQAKEEGEGLMYNLQQQYATKLAEAGEQLAEKADLYAALEQAAYEYGGVNMKDYYDMVQDVNTGERTYTLNLEGEDYLKRAFFTDLQEETSFQQYLANMAENAETADDRKKYQSMLDLYSADPRTARELIGGISRDKWDYKPEDVVEYQTKALEKLAGGTSKLGSEKEIIDRILNPEDKNKSVRDMAVDELYKLAEYLRVDSLYTKDEILKQFKQIQNIRNSASGELLGAGARGTVEALINDIKKAITTNKVTEHIKPQGAREGIAGGGQGGGRGRGL